MEWEKIFANSATDKGLMYKRDRQLIQLKNNQNQTIPSKNGQDMYIDMTPRKTYK